MSFAGGEDYGECGVVTEVLEVVSEVGVGFVVDVVEEASSDAGCGHADVGAGVGGFAEFGWFPDGVDALSVTGELLDLGAGEGARVSLELQEEGEGGGVGHCLRQRGLFWGLGGV